MRRKGKKEEVERKRKSKCKKKERAQEKYLCSRMICVFSTEASVS